METRFPDVFKKLTVRDPKRILLKSPTHTYRIKVLLELFRMPSSSISCATLTLFLSTALEILYEAQGLQEPNFEGLKTMCHVHMFENSEETRPQSPPPLPRPALRGAGTRSIGQLRILYEKLSSATSSEWFPNYGNT